MPLFDPYNTKLAGSRWGASLADVRSKPVTTDCSLSGSTVMPAFSLSKLRYLVFTSLSMAFFTVSPTGDLVDVGIISSPGLVMSSVGTREATGTEWSFLM